MAQDNSGDRDSLTLALRAEGRSFAEIGVRLGVSATRAKQLWQRASRSSSMSEAHQKAMAEERAIRKVSAAQLGMVKHHVFIHPDDAHQVDRLLSELRRARALSFLAAPSE